MMDYTQLIESADKVASELDDFNSFLDRKARMVLRETANAIGALQARVVELEAQLTARTYMDGYSDGKKWALEEAAKVCERLWPDKDCSGHEWSDGWADGTCASADAIRKLKEGL